MQKDVREVVKRARREGGGEASVVIICRKFVASRGTSRSQVLEKEHASVTKE